MKKNTTSPEQFQNLIDKTSTFVFADSRWQHYSFPHSWFITGFVTRVTRWAPLVGQELLTLSEHMSSHWP